MCTIYERNEKRFVDLEGKEYVGYGVDCFEVMNGYKKLFGQICDLSVNLEEVEELVEKLNWCGVSRESFYDVVYDFVCERGFF